MSINWRRNLWIIWTAQVLSLAGFNFAFPFFPYFIQEMGVTDPGKIKLWTGIIAVDSRKIYKRKNISCRINL